MTEREIVGVAIAMAVAAVLALPIPLWAAVAAAALAAVRRHPIVIGVAAMAVTSMLAQRAEVGLDSAPRGRIEGRATLVTDPKAGPWGSSAIVTLERHRFSATFPDDPALIDALAGESFEVTGVAADMDVPFGYRASKHLGGRLTVLTVAAHHPAAWLPATANSIRRSIESSLGSFGTEHHALFTGVVYGDDRDQSEVSVHRFRRAGLSHLMAVSGQNVAFLLLMASPLLMRVELRWRFVISALIIGMFVVVTRAEPSVIRAATMAMVAAYAMLRGRYVTPLRVLAVAIAMLMIVDPLLVWSLGFQLSVGASAALVVLGGRLVRLAEQRRWWHLPLAASVAAQAGTAPILSTVAGSVPVVSPLANLVAVPAAGVVMGYGVTVAPVAGIMGDPFATWVGWPVRALLWLIETAAKLGSASWLPTVGVGGSLGWLVATVSAVSGRRVVKRVGVSVGLVMLCVDAMVGVPSGAVETGEVAEMWVDGGSAVVVLDSSSTVRSVLDGLGHGRVSRVWAVFVVGGGSRSSGVVAAMREVVAVDAVFAADPDLVRDALPLVPMEVAVGDVCVVVGDRGEEAEGPALVAEAVDGPCPSAPATSTAESDR